MQFILKNKKSSNICRNVLRLCNHVTTCKLLNIKIEIITNSLSKCYILYNY